MEYLKSTNPSNMKWSQCNVQKLSRGTKLWHHKNDYKQFKWQKAKQQNLHKTHTIPQQSAEIIYRTICWCLWMAHWFLSDVSLEMFQLNFFLFFLFCTFTTWHLVLLSHPAYVWCIKDKNQCHITLVLWSNVQTRLLAASYPCTFHRGFMQRIYSVTCFEHHFLYLLCWEGRRVKSELAGHCYAYSSTHIKNKKFKITFDLCSIKTPLILKVAQLQNWRLIDRFYVTLSFALRHSLHSSYMLWDLHIAHLNTHWYNIYILHAELHNNWLDLPKLLSWNYG